MYYFSLGYRTRAYFRPPVNPKDIFTLPFSQNVWNGILLISIVIVLMIYLFTWLNCRLHGSSTWYSSESILLVVAIAAQKGKDVMGYMNND
jgi:hypothetical protein